MCVRKYGRGQAMRKLLTALLLTALLSTTMALTASAAPGEANGGRDCYTFEETGGVEEGCFNGGSGKGGSGGRLVSKVNFGEDVLNITSSGGRGGPGGGGRTCITIEGQPTSCFTGSRP